MAYKIQTRNADALQFADASEWLTCEECLQLMPNKMPPEGDLQIVNEQSHIIATTVRKNVVPERSVLKPSRTAKSRWSARVTNVSVRHARNE